MIPVRDVIPSRTFPAVTLAVIALTAGASVAGAALTGPGSGARLSWAAVDPDAFSVWRAATSAFFHADPLQLVSNLLALWIFGSTLEDRTGRARFAAFYLACALVAAAGHVWTQPPVSRPALGASGALAGVLGAYFSMFPHSRVLVLVPVPWLWRVEELPAVWFLAMWLMLQVVSGFELVRGIEGVEGFSFGACASAFVAGALLIRVFRRPERARVEWWHDGTIDAASRH